MAITIFGLRRYRNADLAGGTGGQSARQLRPRSTAVSGLEDPAVGAATVEPVGLAEAFPETRIQDAGIRRIHLEIARARPAVVGQARRQVLPRLAPIGRLEDAPLARVPPQVALGCHIGGIGIGRVRDDLADVVRVPQADVGERRPAVRRLVDPIAPGHAVADARLARAHPDDSGSFWENATSPIDAAPYWSKIGSQVVPAFVDLNTPPEAEATSTTAGLRSRASMSATRPAMLAGPMLRQTRSRVRSRPAGAWAIPGPVARATRAAIAQVLSIRRIGDVMRRLLPC